MWVCKFCESENIQETGNLMETFSLGEITTGEDGLPAPEDGYDKEGDICWDCYEFETFECVDCNLKADTLAELVVWKEDE